MSIATSTLAPGGTEQLPSISFSFMFLASVEPISGRRLLPERLMMLNNFWSGFWVSFQERIEWESLVPGTNRS